MIRYNKKITIKETKYGIALESDRGDNFELMKISSENNHHPITDWWEKQAQTPLRQWQMDAIVKEYWRQHEQLDLFLVYKKGHGYSQPHDIMLAHDPKKKLWILSTQEHTWFVPGNDMSITFNVQDALGGIEDKSSRLEIYEIIDGIK